MSVRLEVRPAPASLVFMGMAILTSAGIANQFYLAGMAIFGGGVDWDVHRIVGSAIVLPDPRAAGASLHVAATDCRSRADGSTGDELSPADRRGRGGAGSRYAAGGGVAPGEWRVDVRDIGPSGLPQPEVGENLQKKCPAAAGHSCVCRNAQAESASVG